VNSEELELSLRTEFESYLSDILAEMRQEVSDFQAKFQTEFEKHKAQLDEVFQDFSSRLKNDRQLDEGFRESVIEHLRLAKDEGARITASAIAEAEDREKENSSALAASVSYSELRDGINEISSQDTQAGILKSLVNHAAQFTPRGAFFIIKNEHFVGWRVFGKEGTTDEQTVREIFLPMSGETVLSEAARSLSPVESNYGTYADDSTYLDKLEFGQPDRMYAIPLIARGRGVAVLYADYGTEGVSVNLEALETLVRVAGLTVELLAASQGTKTQSAPRQAVQYAKETTAPETSEQTVESEPEAAQTFQTDTDYKYQTNTGNEKESAVEESYDSSFEESKPVSEDENYAQPETSQSAYQPEPVSDNFESYYQEFNKVEEEKPEFSTPTETEPDYSWSSSPSYSDKTDETFKSDETFVVGEVVEVDETQTAESAYETKESAQDYSTISSYDFESPSEQFSDTPQASEFEQIINESEIPQFEPANGYSEQAYEAKKDVVPETYAAPEPVETVSSATAAPIKSRLSERNVDLPIEVADDERRLHNDARRFARLLVSEIKLYNEQKVKEGRESSDLYERLREAIDRSREMYEKRVQPPVAAKFDYFHYELISSLADGDEGKLGGSYPGTNV
jgi:hypothetical protein